MSPEPMDQTRGDSTPFLNEGQVASLSRNEVAALCMKAARGAGMSWGLAEEAGYAAAWLVQHGVDGPGQLHAHLAQAEGRSWTDICPQVAPGIWQAPVGRALCPIALGATLCDYADLPEGLVAGARIRIGRVDHPALLIPFLAEISAHSGILFDLEWEGGSAPVRGDPETLKATVMAIGAGQPALVISGRPGTPAPATLAPAPKISAATIAALNALAMRTTVPASDASRAGAGASLTDND